MSPRLARRLGRLEAVAAEDRERRWREACREVLATMGPEHRAIISAWHERPEVRDDYALWGRDLLLTRAERLDMPGLVRAAYALACHRMNTGGDATLPPAVAEVYLEDAGAWPASPCSGCAYLMPARYARERGRWRLVGVYEGACPVCELDSRPNAGG